MSLKDALFLGFIQGVAEWLPVSSSGHLLMFRHLFGLEGGLFFDIFLHLSSLLVIIIFFRKDICELMEALLRKEFKSGSFRLVLYIICATIITGVAGVFLRQYLERITIKYLPYAFLFTSILLFFSARQGKGDITMKSSLFIGFLQAVALLPGVSRSGATISAAKMAGIKDEEAFRFSFLLAIPAILGAAIYEIREIDVIGGSFLLIGFLASFFVGMLMLYLLKKLVVKGKLYLFGFYTLFLSLFLFFTQ